MVKITLFLTRLHLDPLSQFIGMPRGCLRSGFIERNESEDGLDGVNGQAEKERKVKKSSANLMADPQLQGFLRAQMHI